MHIRFVGLAALTLALASCGAQLATPTASEEMTTAAHWQQPAPKTTFGVLADREQISLVPGGDAAMNVWVRQYEGFYGHAQLSVLTPVAGLHGRFEPHGNNMGAVVITADDNVEPGLYNVVVAGTTGSETQAVGFVVEVLGESKLPIMTTIGGTAFDGLWATSYNGRIAKFGWAQLTVGGVHFIPPTTTLDTFLTRRNDGLAFTKDGSLWAVRFNDLQVIKFTPAQLIATGSPAPTVTITSPNLTVTANYLAFTETGDLWVSHPGELIKFNKTNLATTGNVAATTVISGLGTPDGIAFDKDENLWVADEIRSQVVKFTPAQLASSGSPTPAVILSTVAMDPGTPDSLSRANNLAFSENGELFVASFFDSYVVKFTPAQIATSGSPTPVFRLFYGPIFTAPVVGSEWVGFDADNNLWVTSGVNGLISRFTPAQIMLSGTHAITPQLSVTSITSGPTGVAMWPTPPNLPINVP